MSWDEHANGWDEDEAVRTYSGGAYASLLRLEEAGHLVLDGARVLDFGCGTGLLAQKLSPRVEGVVALDTSTEMIRVLRAKIAKLGLSNIVPVDKPLETAIVSEHGLFERPFDIITCSSVCAFLEDYPARLRALVRLLRDGGVFVQWDWELDPESDEPFGLTRPEIRLALEGAGLREPRVELAFDVEFDGQRMRPLMGFGVR